MEKKNNTAKIFRGFSAIRRVSAGRGSRSTRSLLGQRARFSTTEAVLGNGSASPQWGRFSTKVASRQQARLQLQIPRKVAQNRGFKREPRERLHKIAVSSANPARGCAKPRFQARTPREVARKHGFDRESCERFRESAASAANPARGCTKARLQLRTPAKGSTKTRLRAQKRANG